MATKSSEVKKVGSESEKGLGGWSFYPFIVLIGLVIGRIIYNILIGIPQQGNSFPILSVVLVAAGSSFLFGKGKISERAEFFVQSAAHPTVMMMVLIMLLSGAFTAVSSAIGGVSSLSNMLLRVIPAWMIYAGILGVSSVVSLCIGSSVGTITAIVPIAAGLAAQASLNLPLALSAVIGGASLGDNLSFISDTTIAATRGCGVEMRDKFKFNVSLVIPAFIVAFAVYAFLGRSGAGAAVNPQIGDYKVVTVLPYIYILIAALCGVNMIVVLSTGLIFSGIIGICMRSLTFISFMSNINTGMTRMASTLFTAMLVMGMMGIIRQNGGLEWLISRLTKNVSSAKGAQFSVAALSFIMGALIRSTSAIIVAAPLAKDICDNYGVDPRRTASLLDIFATAQNGFVFWAGLTVDCCALVDGVQPTDLIAFAVYPLCIIVVALLSIAFGRSGKKNLA